MLSGPARYLAEAHGISEPQLQWLVRKIRAEAERGRRYTKIQFRDKFGRGKRHAVVWHTLQVAEEAGWVRYGADNALEAAK